MQRENSCTATETINSRAKTLFTAAKLSAKIKLNNLRTCAPDASSVMHNSKSLGSINGHPVDLYTLANSSGHRISITNYGGTITKWRLPNTNDSIILGFDQLEPYLQQKYFLGALIGRFANRIAGGRFTLDDRSYQLPFNDNSNTLHGGDKGFDKVVWTTESHSENSLTLSYFSKDGEQGFPGNLRVSVAFNLSDANELSISYTATTDFPTIVNLTGHPYFNLSGDHTRSIEDHLLQIEADQFTPCDVNAIPTGEIASVTGTPYDFRESSRIKEKIEETVGGYDNNYVLRGGRLSKPELAATLQYANRKLEVFTTEPGLQFYSGNFLNGEFFGRRTGLCLETQNFPDAPNQPHFPSAVLRPTEQYRSTTVYALTIY